MAETLGLNQGHEGAARDYAHVMTVHHPAAIFMGSILGIGLFLGGCLLIRYPRFTTGINGTGDGLGARSEGEKQEMITNYEERKRQGGKHMMIFGAAVVVAGILIGII